MAQAIHHSPYLLSSFLEKFPELVVSKGGDLSEICASAQVPLEVVTGRHQLMPFEKFILLLEKAAETLNYPEIALDLAARQTCNTLGPMFLILYGCQTIDEALNKIVQYLDILVSGFVIELIESEQLLQIVFNINLPNLVHRQQFQNYLLASTVSVIRGLSKKRHPLRSCFFMRPEPDAEQQKKHAMFFGCPVAFSADKMRIIIEKTIIDERVLIDRATLKQHCYFAYNTEDTLQERVANILTLALPSGQANLPLIANSLGVSTRTLRRQLASQSVSFSTLLDSVRLSLANQYLQNTHYRLIDIAALLGYKNQSAFTRFYLRICGVTPKEYREAIDKTNQTEI